ncbi:MAG TPA: class I SAM-dependent methyltransferase [Blastocatellia bacterium]|nr:class I SAM-dependent methyltransferase [Blastocatellia bacterium]
MDQQKTTDLQATYDRVAGQYVERIFNELEHKPLDRALLDRFAKDVQGPACDLGCGPGHVTRYLHGRGANVIGIDLSPGMIEQARQLNPEMEFRQGNMLSLDFEDDSLAGIAAFYSIIHIPREEVTDALRELKRVLRPGGLLLLAFHLGEEVIHLDEWWGEKVSADFIFFGTDEMAGYLKEASFGIEEVIEREPYENVEHPSRRGYVFARKPKQGFPR